VRVRAVSVRAVKVQATLGASCMVHANVRSRQQTRNRKLEIGN
jgi:hypothetical protein